MPSHRLLIRAYILHGLIRIALSHRLCCAEFSRRSRHKMAAQTIGPSGNVLRCEEVHGKCQYFLRRSPSFDIVTSGDFRASFDFCHLSAINTSAVGADVLMIDSVCCRDRKTQFPAKNMASRSAFTISGPPTAQGRVVYASNTYDYFTTARLSGRTFFSPRRIKQPSQSISTPYMSAAACSAKFPLHAKTSSRLPRITTRPPSRRVLCAHKCQRRNLQQCVAYAIVCRRYFSPKSHEVFL